MGYSIDEIETFCKEKYKKFLKVKKRTILKTLLNFSLFKETKVEGLIDGVIVEKNIDEKALKKNVNRISDICDKKLAIATVDTKSMKECIFTSDITNLKEDNINYIDDINVGKAVRASMSFPAIFTTTNYKDYNFIDGGTIDNLPAKVLKDMGAEKIIAVSFDLSKYEPTNSMENVLVRALDIFSSKDVRRGQECADITVEIYNPDTSLVKMNEFKKTINNGYNAVMEKKEELLLLK